MFKTGDGIEHKALNSNGYPVMAQCVHRDDIVSYLWGKEVILVAEILDAPEAPEAPVKTQDAPPYFEDDGLFYCNYEDCEKVLKSAKGIQNHINKEHE